MATLNFKPAPSTEPFIWADKFSNFIVGPVGSTKTTASIMKIAYEASRIAACEDGIRRSRCAVIRNTNQMLWDTTIPDFLKWFPEGQWGTLERTKSKYLLKFADVECEVLFRGLDDANDVRRLLSLQLTFGFMDEFREINPDIYNALTGRLGRYPDQTMNGVGPCDDKGNQVHKVWGSTNPPDADTFWEKLLTDPPGNASVTFQPGGLDPEADWISFLPKGYYANLADGKTEDWIDVYINGKFGKSLQGQPVFRCFSPLTHVAKEPLQPNPGATTPLIIGVDAGLNPTAVITQLTYDGRLMVLDAITGNAEGMGAHRFINEKLQPLLINKYNGMQCIVIIDPAAFQRAPTDERSVGDIFKANGFVTKPAKTNSIAARLGAGEKYMTKIVDGKPALMIDPSLIAFISTLRTKYRYRINTKGEREEKPDKNHPWSDYADAFTYACLHADGGGLFGSAIGGDKAREIEHISAKGWT